MTAPTEPTSGRRRSILAQDRSRRTREALVEAALALWTERGYDTGFDSTTVEEIARTAGVTKGTFYFHFDRKVDVLLEMNAATDRSMAVAMRDAIASGERIDVGLQRALAVLSERIERMPREALGQILREYYRSPVLARERSEFRTQLPVLLEGARLRGELPRACDPERVANLVAAVVLSAGAAWADGRSDRLGPELAYAAEVVFAGVRAAGH